MTDQRPKHKRVRTELPLSWRNTFKSVIHNISRGGLFFKSSVAPEVGDRLELNFELPGDEANTDPLALMGEVRWVSTHSSEGANAPIYGVGVEFVDIDKQESRSLDKFISSEQQKRQGKPRLPVRIIVDYHFAGQSFRTVANDISQNGMFLVTSEPLELEDMMQLKFRLPESDGLLNLRGIVRWRHDAIPEKLSSIISPGMGIEFINMAVEDQALIAEFIETRVDES